MSDIDDIVEYYSNLLIIQYNGLPKAKAIVELFVREILANGILLDIREAFNIDTAVGVQLDILGKYVDIDRFYQGQILTDFFAVTSYNEFPLDTSKKGLTDYTQGFTKFGKTITYNDYLSNNQTLGDDDFRFLIRLRIMQNNINHSHQAIDKVLFDFFGTTLFADTNNDMTMYYFYQGQIPAILQAALQKRLFLKPIGVQFSGLIQQKAPFFGFRTYAEDHSPYVTGFTNYTDGFTFVGEMFNYSKITAGY